MENENRKIPEIIMDILKDYPLIDGGRKPLLDYLNEIMAAYSDIEKEYLELSLWEEDMKKDLREMKIAIKQLKKNNS